MFTDTGMPTGYGQTSPFTDQAKPTGPAQRMTPPANPNTGLQGGGFPTDPTLAGFRSPSMRRIGDPHGAPAPTPGPLANAITPQAQGGLGPTQGGLGLNQGETQDAYLQRLLGTSQFANNPQGAIDQFNTSVYGGAVHGAGDNGYGKSPAYYANGQGQIGLPGYYLVKQADGSWQRTDRQPQGRSNLMNAVVPPGPTHDASNPLLAAVMQNLQNAQYQPPPQV